MAAGGTARRKPTCSAIMVPWLKADQRQRRGRQLMPLQFGVEKGVEHRRGGVDAGPALARIAEGERKPFAPDRRLAAGLRRVRRDESGVRQQALPGAADVDQVVAVGAIAVQEHDELLAHCPSAARCAGRRVQPFRFSFALIFFAVVVFFFAAGVLAAG